MPSPLVEFTSHGIYCRQADIYIDPTRTVKRAVITHAHSDHAKRGHHSYLAHRSSASILRLRLGDRIPLQTLDYNEPIYQNGVRISLHPAGHIYGSAQVRLEYGGDVWVVSGDYKTEPDTLCPPFEPVPCHTFITESTFGLPIFQWPPQSEVFREMNQWWRDNQAQGKVSIVFAYALGKAQRVMGGLDTSIGKIFVTSAVWNVNEALRKDGARLPLVTPISRQIPDSAYRGGMVIAPMSAANLVWLKKFQSYATANASGWMAMRNATQRHSVDRGFVLSDHADWNGLNEAVDATGAKRVFVMHGYQSEFSRHLNKRGIEAYEATDRFTEDSGTISEINEAGGT